MLEEELVVVDKRSFAVRLNVAVDFRGRGFSSWALVCPVSPRLEERHHIYDLLGGLFAGVVPPLRSNACSGGQ